MPYDSTATPESVSDALCAVLRRAGVEPASAIRVVGAGGLQALVWLCRHGYQKVSFMNGANPAEPADVVLVPSTCRPEMLELILAHASRLSPDGLVVLHTRRAETGQGEATEAALGRHGFRVEQHLRDLRRDLYVARLTAATPAPRTRTA